MRRPLDGKRVLDVSQAWAGPYCGMMLGDFGAEVIKIEPLDGDHVRKWSPTSCQGVSPHFLAANRNKKSVSLNLKTPEGRELFLDLAARSDVLIENFRPGVMDRLGLGYAEVSARNPGIVYCSISGFGQTGPLSQKPAYDLIASGYGGVMSVTGEPGGRYCKPGVPLADVMASMTAGISVLTALLDRQQSGKGAYLDIAMMDTQVSLMAYHVIAYQLEGEIPQPMGSGHPLMVPYQTFRTGSFEINIAVLTERQWQDFCRLLGLQEWLSDPRLTTAGLRTAHRQEMVLAIEERLKERRAEDWLALLEEVGIPCGPINTVDRLVDEEHLKQRGMFLEWDHPRVGRLRIPGAPWMGDAGLPEWTPPPELGEHTAEVLTGLLGLPLGRLEALEAEGVIAMHEAGTEVEETVRDR